MGGLVQMQQFKLFLIKPTHYDDDGYPIQWLRSVIPANSLASLYSLAEICAEQKALGPDVEIDIEAFDETNTVVQTRRIIRQIRRAEAGGMVGLVGVQSNQFPRAVDIARPLCKAGIPVVIGGFHVSGCLAMLPEIPADIREAMDLGISIYAGEAEEGRLDEVLRDARDGTLKPVYNYMHDLPAMDNAVTPILPAETVKRVVGHYSSFDAGRGCPFQCSFCTIINVQGRKSRYRTPDDIEQIIRANLAQGITRFFITDDNFARNKGWEAILDRMIELREGEGLRFRFIIQVDTLCHRLPNFIEKAARAGCNRVFIGLENINPDNLIAAKKKQNKIWEYREMLQAWKDQGVITYVGYILGFPSDTPETIRRDVDILKNELAVDLVEFNLLTPLPGSEDHRNLYLKGVWMDPDMNKYDLNHVTMEHPTMSRDELFRAYRDAWHQFYTPEHMERVMRRGVAKGIKPKKLMLPLVAFTAAINVGSIHPLEAGVFRRKVWNQRRHGLPRENPLIFFPRRLWETIHMHAWLGLIYWRFSRIMNRVANDPNAKSYMDMSLEPERDEEHEGLEMMQIHGEAIPKGTYGAPKRPAKTA